MPIDFDTTSDMPKASKIALYGPPEIMPVPFGADLKITVLDENFAFISWWMVLPSLKGILTMVFLASSEAFLIASGTSLAFPEPNPTLPWPSPLTTKAEKPNLLPPLTTLETRLTEINFSINSLFTLF